MEAITPVDSPSAAADPPDEGLTEADRRALADAVRRLESPSLAARLAQLAGKPVAMLSLALPATAQKAIAKATTLALDKALKMAVTSLADRRLAGGRITHGALASAAGAVGGAFGLTALAVELPVSTTIMLRAIAAIAREEGEDLSDPAVGLACLEVFALGSPQGSGEGGHGDGSYFALRSGLARIVAEGVGIVTGPAGLREGAPMLLRFVSQIASRFGIVVSQKLAAQAVPVLGALGGGAVNLAFVEHFQSLARGHFTVRRLERAYGAERVRVAYERLRDAAAKPPGSA